MSAVSSSLLAISKEEVAVDVSVEVMGDVGINCKSDEWLVVEWFMVDARDWREDFLVDPFDIWFVCHCQNLW